ARAIIQSVQGVSADKIADLSARIEKLLVERQRLSLGIRQFANRLFSLHGDDAKQKVQNFVRRFVNEARLKRNLNGYTFRDPFSGDKIELRFLLAGGGAGSTWYKSAIQGLDPDKNPAFDGIKRVRLETVTQPAHFDGEDFPRFVIALGLTNLPDELEDASR